MIKKIQIEKTPFQKYFMEAPGDTTDTVSVRVAPRQNRGTDYSDDTDRVTVAPRSNRGTDYAADDDEDTTTDQGAGNEAPAPAEDAGGDNPNQATDYSSDEEGGDTGADDPPDEDNEGEEGGEDEGGGEDPNQPTDYSDEEGGEGGDEGGGEAQPQQPEQTPEEKDEQVKKLHMYKRFLHLYNVVESFIEKTRNVVKDSPIENSVIKIVSNNLSDIHDNMYDYMMVKFRTDSYVQVLVYFETIISLIRLNFELLRNNRVNLKQ